MTTVTQILRFILLLIVGLFGMAMALVFMVSTAIAIGILYASAKIRGRPFGVRSYWGQRRQYRGPGSPASRPSRSRNDPDIIDAEVRELP